MVGRGDEVVFNLLRVRREEKITQKRRICEKDWTDEKEPVFLYAC